MRHIFASYVLQFAPFFLGGGRQWGQWGQVPPSVTVDTMLFATVSVPISDWWGGSHAIKRKKIAYQQAQDQLADNAQLLYQQSCDKHTDAYADLQNKILEYKQATGQQQTFTRKKSSYIGQIYYLFLLPLHPL